jgi:hypothetical protein
VTVTDTLPGDLKYISIQPNSCSFNITATCALGTLASGATAIVTIVVRPTGLTTLTNTASVTANEPDPDTANNSQTVTTTVQQPNVPQLRLPWSAPEVWFYTGGPHCDEADAGVLCPQGAVRHAVDFAPEQQIPCPTPTISTPDIKSDRWVVAAADGRVARRENSLVEIHHTPGNLHTGYAHLAEIQVERGEKVQAGQRLGHPSCAVEAGQRTTGVHLHFYFKSGNKKGSADDQVLSGWTLHAAGTNYNGTITKLGEGTRTADAGRCAPDRSDLPGCTVQNIRNDLRSDNSSP